MNLARDIVFEGKRYWAPYGSNAPVANMPDTSRYKNDATFQNGLTWTQLDGGLFVPDMTRASSHYIEIPDSESLKPQFMTLLFWLKVGLVGQWQALFSKYDAGTPANYDTCFQLSNTNTFVLEELHIAAAGRTLIGNTVAVQDGIYFIALTYDGAAIKLYINGEYDNQVVVAGAIDWDDANITIGGTYSGANCLEGIIGLPRILKTALDQEVINFKYESEAYLLGA